MKFLFLKGREYVRCVIYWNFTIGQMLKWMNDVKKSHWNFIQNWMHGIHVTTTELRNFK